MKNHHLIILNRKKTKSYIQVVIVILITLVNLGGVFYDFTIVYM